jgi:hypothetical protein
MPSRTCEAPTRSPPPGKTERHPLNPGGDRDANRTLYLIAVVRLRYCQRTREYTMLAGDGREAGPDSEITESGALPAGKMPADSIIGPRFCYECGALGWVFVAIALGI